MQNLLLYLYSRHIHSNDPNAQLFSKQQSIRIFNLSQEQLQFYNTMLIRNFFTYSPATMEIKLSVKHLLGIYRLPKFQSIIQENGLNTLWSEWIKNQMMPINYHGKKIQDCKFVYVDYKQENPKQDKQLQIQQAQINQVKRKNSKTKQNKKQVNSNKAPIIAQKNQQKLKTILNINIIQLTTQIQNRLICAQLRIQPNDIIKPQKRQQALMVLQHQKIQQYINERFNTQILMAYNFINKYPYIDEKTLLNKTMLPIAQLRKSVAKLISQGWVNFYPQNSRSLLYKSLPQQRIKQRCCDKIAQALLNMYILLDKIQSSKQIMQDEQKTNVMLKSIQELDNILMIFMA